MPYTYTKLETMDHDRVYQLLCDVFGNASAPHVALEITAKEYFSVLRPAFDKVVSEGHTFVAKFANTGEVVGAIICCDFMTDPNADAQGLAKLEPLSALLCELSLGYQPEPALERGDGLLVDMAAVDAQHQGRGVYRALRETVHAHAKAAGFRVVLGELSSATTQRVCVDYFGHRVIAEIAYRDFEHEGRRPFASITEPPTVQLVEGRL